ncbi:hypothetical protein M0657_010801 [Pyricularia oryzae]|uniref:Uncharacterized protein n=4 Tax=Pyricularia oryzae TaxID=318829 RepID=Q2KEX2_PYRO7|nr:hypothetical protein MGCH7_ch7g914 [Pyricularia oryzae 70-15]ELQ44509.1 hypothetical protein OOU_Y34scaffold00084g3 [Pyricularia oryzae Y34]KAI7911713.1 hypothetical protein M0657_010801 [Pyricularia oryzae]KAI7916941.1 hypothetical protein M9X92_007619 [Pyricularia oryzae]QBZ65558.1 hypothetical protein PoMZ_12520 [Pyricularia oryzae]
MTDLEMFKRLSVVPELSVTFRSQRSFRYATNLAGSGCSSSVWNLFRKQAGGVLSENETILWVEER